MMMMMKSGSVIFDFRLWMHQKPFAGLPGSDSQAGFGKDDSWDREETRMPWREKGEKRAKAKQKEKREREGGTEGKRQDFPNALFSHFQLCSHYLKCMRRPLQ